MVVVVAAAAAAQVYASQPPDEAKRESQEGQGDERVPSKWVPPDQVNTSIKKHQPCS